MNQKALRLFHELLKKGWIDRGDKSRLWEDVEDAQAREELDQMGTELGFEILPAQDRIYLVPTQDNDLFLKNNVDYRGDIKASSDTKNRDLYLLNYLAIYLLYLFFKGEGTDALVRDFITKEEFIKEFSQHCEGVTRDKVEGDESEDDYSNNFRTLAANWLGKKEGDPASKRMEDRYGVVNKLLLKFKADDLFAEEEGGILRPTKKTRDLMPYVLRKSRIQMIQQWIEEEDDHASNL